MTTIVTVQENTGQGDKYVVSYEKACGSGDTDIRGGYDAGNAAAVAVRIAMRHPPAIIIACEDVSKLIPDKYKT